MLVTTNSEDELANVIAHEIGHVEAQPATPNGVVAKPGTSL